VKTPETGRRFWFSSIIISTKVKILKIRLLKDLINIQNLSRKIKFPASIRCFHLIVNILVSGENT
jgi:hypothetical protein